MLDDVTGSRFSVRVIDDLCMDKVDDNMTRNVARRYETTCCTCMPNDILACRDIISFLHTV